MNTESKGELLINNTKSPFKISLENLQKEFETHNVSLRLPGYIKYEHIRVNVSSCNLIIHVVQNENVTNATFLVQYGRTPKLDEYDAKIVITEGVAEIAVNSSYLKALDGRSLLMWNMTEYRYGASEDQEIVVGYMYEGPMPDIHRFGNQWTYDVLKLPQSYNYTITSFCAACSYWHEEKEIWTRDGCSVS